MLGVQTHKLNEKCNTLGLMSDNRGTLGMRSLFWISDTYLVVLSFLWLYK